MKGRRVWSAVDVPDQTGRVFVITGANGGIGLAAARVLAQRGARVVMACRNQAKAHAAAASIRDEHPAAELDVRPLDLADLSSVRGLAGGVLQAYDRVDVLINNAGVLAVPRAETTDHFEMHLGVNHLGHFALTGLLLPALEQHAGRVVTVASTVHRLGRVDLDDLHKRGSYGEWQAYFDSKLANLLFALELDRRLRAASASAVSVACHPGYVHTELLLEGPRQKGSRARQLFFSVAGAIAGQSPADGALATLRAAADPAMRGGEYLGPGGLLGLAGAPVPTPPAARALDRVTAAALWDVSTELTGVDFGLPQG